MALSSTLSNCVIEGNSVDSGFYTADGTTVSSYTYNQLLLTSADCKIKNNNFSAISASGTMLSLNNCSCDIQGNTFKRGSASITAYIASTGSQDHMIVKNIFDSNTVDGSSIDLVTGLSTASIYQENKNQTAYAFLSALEGEKQWDTQTPNYINISGSFPTFTTLSTGDAAIHALVPYVEIQIDSGDISNHFYNRIFALNPLLPSGVTILELKQGLFSRYSGGNTFEYGNTFFYLSVTSAINNNNTGAGTVDAILDAQHQVTPNIGSGTQGVADTRNVSFAVSDSAHQTAFQTTTQYLTIDTSSVPQFYTLSYNETVWVTLYYNFANSADIGFSTEIYASPIRVKFQW